MTPREQWRELLYLVLVVLAIVFVILAGTRPASDARRDDPRVTGNGF